MGMIDWSLVGFNALWITGLSLVTAALSFANYLAGVQKLRIGLTLKTPACQIVVGLGLVCFCLGWAGCVSVEWERLLWAVLACIIGLRTWKARKLSNP
jgi:hypothetical protein